MIACSQLAGGAWYHTRLVCSKYRCGAWTWPSKKRRFRIIKLCTRSQCKVHSVEHLRNSCLSHPCCRKRRKATLVLCCRKLRKPFQTPVPPRYHAVISGSPETFGSALNELDLLDTTETINYHLEHELRTAPVFTRSSLLHAGIPKPETQYGVLGQQLSIHQGDDTGGPDDTDSRLYVNTNAPFSALVCGVQGSGKSHTVSVLLENMFYPNYSTIGLLTKPLSGLVLHFGTGGTTTLPCEAAWLASPTIESLVAPKVIVYVSPSSLRNMTNVYSRVGGKINVRPLEFCDTDLDAEALMTLMGLSGGERTPLYVQIIIQILRDLGEQYSYAAFKQELEKKKKHFNPAQLSGLEQRMSLLESFIVYDQTRQSIFSQGELTIVDLTDPFIDPSIACGLFEVVTRLFVRADVGSGKVLVVDEAHKYLNPNHGEAGLTKSLLELIRLQRHLAMRVIISTQEPTVVPPMLLDLCNMSILHRFSSPRWWEHIVKHVSAEASNDAFDKLVTLQTGQAILFAPSGLLMIRNSNAQDSGSICVPYKVPGQLGRRYMIMKTRKRITRDGGASILIV
ncbi:hypothetical protein ABKN59_000329 [Abortiporus biennis]